MKIALIGYGKMGHAIERIARERGHEIVAIIDVDNNADIDGEAFASADAAIEFTTPSTAPDNVMRAAAAGVPVICGSTGWAARRAEVEKRVTELGGALLASSNFSIGVNVFNIVNRKLARLMSHLPQYRPHRPTTSTSSTIPQALPSPLPKGSSPRTSASIPGPTRGWSASMRATAP